jgi:hypothetical protein
MLIIRVLQCHLEDGRVDDELYLALDEPLDVGRGLDGELLRDIPGLPISGAEEVHVLSELGADVVDLLGERGSPTELAVSGLVGS